MKQIHSRLLQAVCIVLSAASSHASLFSATNSHNLRIVAWHEAGHAIAMIHNDTAALVNHISIQPQHFTNLQGKSVHTQGHVICMQTNDIHKSVEEFENHIISALAGAVAEQIVQSQPMLTQLEEIIKFLAHPAYATDMHLAHMYAKEIVTIQTFQLLTHQQIEHKMHAIIIKLYAQTYKFMVKHKNEVKKMAEQLMLQQNLSCDEAYDFMHADKPAMVY